MKKKNEIWHRRLRRFFLTSASWLMPGLGVKRWVLLVFLGTTLLGVGFAVVILDIYRNAPETWWLPLLSAASLRVLARPVRALIFGGLGLLMVGAGLWGINRALMAPFVVDGQRVVDTLASYRRRERGPRMVVIGGGHGLATLLRGLKNHSHNITAVVSVADDGGSSGVLRRSMGILPPGDIRNCLAALSNDEALLGQLFQYRFPASAGGGLDGHSFGNLFITALAEITGSFEEAVAESGRVLSVHGQVLPATLHDVALVADKVVDQAVEVRIAGESNIPAADGRVRRIWLEPNDPPAYPGVIQAILNAELIVVGPGSLYTSVLPNLLVPDIVAAIRSSRALKVYVANVATQPGETSGFTCGDHVHVIEEHVGSELFDLIVCNNHFDVGLPDGVEWVRAEDDLDEDHAVYRTDLADPDYPWRHNSQKLAQVLMDLYQERTGPLVE